MLISIYSFSVQTLCVHGHISLNVLYVLNRTLILGGSRLPPREKEIWPTTFSSHFHLLGRMSFVSSLRNPAGIWTFLWRKQRSNVWERYEIPSCLWAVTHALSLLPHILLAILALDLWYSIPFSVVPILCLPLYSLYNNTIQIRYVFELSATTLSPPCPL